MGLDDMKKVFDKYSGGAGADWFQLKDDGDNAIVRFLYRGENDIDYTVVHEVEIDGSTRKVECLEFKGKDCPLCQADYKNRARMFLQLLDYREGEVKVWERGKTFLPEITTFIDNYEPIYTIRAKVTRHGERGDPQTQYKISPLVNDDMSMEDSEENFAKVKEKRVEVFGPNNIVIRRGKDDLKKMVNGTFSFQNDNKDNPMKGSGNNNSSGNSGGNNNSNENPADYF